VYTQHCNSMRRFHPQSKRRREWGGGGGGGGEPFKNEKRTEKPNMSLSEKCLHSLISLSLYRSSPSPTDSELLLLNLLTQHRADYKFIHVGDHSSSSMQSRSQIHTCWRPFLLLNAEQTSSTLSHNAEQTTKPISFSRLHETFSHVSFSLSPGEDQRFMKPILAKTRHETHSGEGKEKTFIFCSLVVCCRSLDLGAVFVS
jgi:hypothetical protein